MNLSAKALKKKYRPSLKYEINPRPTVEKIIMVIPNKMVVLAPSLFFMLLAKGDISI